MFAFPTTSETLTTLASYIPAIWGEKVNEFFRLKLMLADFFTDRSSEVAEGGNILYTPTTTEMAANAKVNATAVNLAALTFLLKAYIMSVYDYRMLYMQTSNRQAA